MIMRAIERCIEKRAAPGDRLGVGRRAYAGGRGQPDADGEDFGRR